MPARSTTCDCHFHSSHLYSSQDTAVLEHWSVGVLGTTFPSTPILHHSISPLLLCHLLALGEKLLVFASCFRHAVTKNAQQDAHRDEDHHQI